MKLSRDFLRLNIIPAVLLLGVLLTAAFTFFYSATLRTADGDIVYSNWPRDFTRDFAQYITEADGEPALAPEGLEALRRNGLWLQLLDADGRELLSYSRPASAPTVYRPYELLSLYQYGDGESSVFVSRADAGGSAYTYLIGFPLNVSKVTMYLDSARYNSGKLAAFATVGVTALLILALAVFFNAVISRNLERICASLRAVAARSYTPNPSRTFLREIYDAIDTLDGDLEAADRQRERDARARDEWLANINHDLKTPLAPIRGYAELLAGESPESSETARYGRLILKNALYAESLVDDLKLCYQLQSGMLPLKMERCSLTRFVRELIIDILNSPDYEGREIAFDSGEGELCFEFDGRLMRRALTNVIVNALRHNAPDAEVRVRLSGGGCPSVSVSDNGSGMTAQELEGLFSRYYRGGASESRPEGSGLGMAIAREIVEAHGGVISAESEPGRGSTVTMTFPKK